MLRRRGRGIGNGLKPTRSLHRELGRGRFLRRRNGRGKGRGLCSDRNLLQRLRRTVSRPPVRRGSFDEDGTDGNKTSAEIVAMDV